MSAPVAAVFIIGKVTGVGILLLPNALSDTGKLSKKGVYTAFLLRVPLFKTRFSKEFIFPGLPYESAAL